MQPDRGRGPALLTIAWATVLLLVITTAWLFQYHFMWGYLDLEDTDLLIFREAARAVLDGQPLYDLRFDDVGGWTWPPFGLLAVIPSLLVPEPYALAFAYVANAAMLAAVVLLCAQPLLARIPDRSGRTLGLVGLVLISMPLTPVADTFGLGQAGLLLLLLVTVDLTVVARRRPAWHGVLIGLATAVKLTPGLFIVHLAATRQWRAAATSAGTAVGAWALAALILWQDSIDYWGGLLFLRVNERVDGFGSWVYNQSWMGLVDGLPGPWPTALWALLSTITVVVALRASARSQRAGNPVRVIGLVGLASVLVTPIAWHHHAVWVVPALLSLIGDGRVRWRIGTAAALAVVLMTPSRLPGLPSDRYTTAYVVLLALLVYLASEGRKAWQNAPHETARDDATQ